MSEEGHQGSTITQTFASHWLWLFTTLILVVAGIVFAFSPSLSDSAQVGEFVAGFSSALAFLWLIASLQLQRKEISLQRQELTLQRVALEKQAREERLQIL